VPVPLATENRITRLARSTVDPATKHATPHVHLSGSRVADDPVAARTTPPATQSGPTTKVSADPVITTKAETEVHKIPYTTRFVHDPTLPIGVKWVRSSGTAGRRTVRFLVTLTNGHQTGRRVLSSIVTRQPRPRIIALGDRNLNQYDDQTPGAGFGWGHESWQDRHRDGADYDGPCGLLCAPWGRSASYSSERP
jgi:surface rod structure-forming protein G